MTTELFEKMKNQHIRMKELLIYGISLMLLNNIITPEPYKIDLIGSFFESIGKSGFKV